MAEDQVWSGYKLPTFQNAKNDIRLVIPATKL